MKGRPKNSISKKTAKYCQDMRMLFEDKTNPLKGLSSDELISLFYHIPMQKVLDMKIITRRQKWETIKHIKSYLVRTNQIAIISKPLSKGTIVSNAEFGKRILGRTMRMFFRCLDSNEAETVRKEMETIANGCRLTGNSTVETTEEQIHQLEILQKLNNPIRAR